jgi:putative transcriptional regulator
MPLVRMSFAEARRRAEKEPVDWARIDAMTDDDIARQIAEDPDVAPDMSEALERGAFVRLHIVDVFGIRTRMGLSHEGFAERFGLNPVEVKEWEAMGGVPDETIRTYLRVIEREPEAVARAVDAMARDEKGAKRAVAP